MSNLQSAKVTIRGEVQSRTIMNSKNMPKAIHAQPAQLETEGMRIGIEVEVDDPKAGYPVGNEYYWDLAADLTPGRFGPELARRMTLIPAGQAKPVAAQAKA